MGLNYQTLLDGVKEYRKFAGSDEAYKKYVLDQRQVWENLDQISKDDVERIIIGFLKAWNIRNINRISRSSNSLEKALKTLNKHFNVLRGKNLLDINFNEKVNIDEHEMKISDVIKEIYKRISEVESVGPTSASKIMHGVIPELFMMWDEKIRNGYGYAGNEVGYLRFMCEMQRILKNVMETYGGEPDDLCHEAYPEMKKPLTKLLDEFNYMKFTRGENLPNPIEDC